LPNQGLENRSADQLSSADSTDPLKFHTGIRCSLRIAADGAECTLP